MSKKILWWRLILFSFLIIIFCNLMYSMYNINQIQQHNTIETSVLYINNNSINISNFKSKTSQKILFQEYIDSAKEDFIMHDSKNIYLFEDNNWNNFYIADYLIEEKPVKINDLIFFVSSDPKENSQFPDRFIWSFCNGKIDKFSNYDIAENSAILAYEDNLIFVEGNNIICKNIYSGKQSVLAKGSYICWKEEGKSFFYQAFAEGLSVYDIDLGEKSLIDKEINLLSSPIYDSKDDVLFFVCDNPKNKSSNIKPIRGFYFLDDDIFITMNYYFNSFGFMDYEEFTSKPISSFYWE